MPTTRPFAYNTGQGITGASQLGSIAIGVSGSGYADNLGGVKWWNGPDEDTIPDEFVSYGKTTPEQSTITGRLYFWITLDELEWKDKLLVDFGVIVTDPEKIIQPESNPPI